MPTREELRQRLRAKINNKTGQRTKKLTPSSAALKVVDEGRFVSIRGVIAALRQHTQFPEFFDACIESKADGVSHAVAEHLLQLGPDPTIQQVEAIVAAVPRGRPPYNLAAPPALVEAAAKMLQVYTKVPPVSPDQPADLRRCRRWIDFALIDAKIDSPLLMQMRTAYLQLSATAAAEATE
jgi:lysozyme family protein